MKRLIRLIPLCLLALLCGCNGLESSEEQATPLKFDLTDLVSDVQNGAEVADITTMERDGRAVGYTVSFADGCAVTLLGQEDGSVVTALSEDSENYYFEIEGGERIALPKAQTKPFTVELTGDEVELSDGGSVTAGYRVTGAEGDLEVTVMAGEGWSSEVVETSATEGKVKVTAPDPIPYDKVLVSFKDATGRQVVRALRLTTKSAVQRGNIETYTFYGLNYFSIDPNQVDHETALRRYREAVEAGIQIMEAAGLEWWRGYDWSDEALIALDLAQEAGLKLSLTVDRLGRSTMLENFVRKVKDHPALWGYKVMDEPSADDYANILKVRQVIESIDPNHLCYVNLKPDGGTFGPNASYCTANYYEYVDRFIKETEADFVSFDEYPCFPDHVHDMFWYSELAILTERAKSAGLDLWGFAASTLDYDGYGYRCKPNLASIRFQHYTNLLYGAQCLEYFLWGVVTLYGQVWDNCSCCPTDPAGDINYEDETYEAIKTFHQEVRNRAFVFDNCDVKWVAFYKDIPDKCDEVDMSKLPGQIMSLSSESGLVLARSENDGGKSEYFCVKSRTHLKSIDVRLRFRYPVQTVERDGSLKAYNPGDYNFTIDPGDILIIKTK